MNDYMRSSFEMAVKTKVGTVGNTNQSEATEDLETMSCDGNKDKKKSKK